MNIYIIVINKDHYVKAITFGGDPFIQVIPTYNIEKSAWYEEDKANIYCNQLNALYRNSGMTFELQLVGIRDEHGNVTEVQND